MALSPKEAIPKAKAAIQRALELDDSLAEAHSTLAEIRVNYDWDWPGAEKEIRWALELNPGSANVHWIHAYYLTALGRIEEAIAAQSRAVQLDPVSPGLNITLGRTFYFARRYEEAVRQYRRAIQLDPNNRWSHFFLATTLYQMGQYDEFAKELQTWAVLTGDQEHKKIADAIGRTYQTSGHRAVWKMLVEWWKKRVARGVSQPASLAMQYATVGEKDEAIFWLQKSLQERPRTLIYIKVEPQFDSLRSDPRFQDIVKKMGLPP